MFYFKINTDKTLTKISENIYKDDSDFYIKINEDSLPVSKYGKYKIDGNNNIIVDVESELSLSKHYAFKIMYDFFEGIYNSNFRIDNKLQYYYVPSYKVNFKNFKINSRYIDLNNIKILIDITKDNETINFRKIDNTYVELNKQQLVQLKNELNKYFKLLYEFKWIYEEKINNCENIDNVEDMQFTTFVHDKLNNINNGLFLYTYIDNNNILYNYFTDDVYKRYKINENKIIGVNGETGYFLNKDIIIDSNNNETDYKIINGNIVDSNGNIIDDSGFTAYIFDDTNKCIVDHENNPYKKYKIDEDNNIIGTNGNTGYKVIYTDGVQKVLDNNNNETDYKIINGNIVDSNGNIIDDSGFINMKIHDNLIIDESKNWLYQIKGIITSQ